MAEAGPEAIILLDGSARSKSLWERTGELIGVGRGGGRESIVINNYFSPVIHGTGAEILPKLKEQQRSFIDEFKSKFESFWKMVL